MRNACLVDPNYFQSEVPFLYEDIEKPIQAISSRGAGADRTAEKLGLEMNTTILF
jgi:hypothetical protein